MIFIYRVLLVVAIGLCSYSTMAQGKLMLVGGGGESSGGWSDAPYQWMVTSAPNKRIAIISYSDADNWLPNYFLNLGAEEAVNIKIDSRNMANESAMLDSIAQYDGLFFKGGDQSRYYEYYKNTAVQAAIEEIYNRGGVIGETSAGMAILSGVIFTASNGSAYPYDALSDIYSQYMTLENDFLSFYPNYLFDTHFIERGRTARLIGFLANWYANENELINGIGIDDRTAFCINSQGVGRVYGTGAASIYLPDNFQTDDESIINSEVKAIQLTHGQSFDLISKEVLERNLANHSQTNTDLPYYQVYATAETKLNKTSTILEEVLANELLGQKILIICDQANSELSSYLQFFEESTSSEINVLEIAELDGQEEQVVLRNHIRQSSLLVYLEPSNLINYLHSGPTGELLKTHMTRNKITNVFLGDISNKLGKSYANNIYQDPFNAYYNDLNYSEGLNLLKDFNIIGNAYDLDNKDYYENISSAVVDRLLHEQLKYGVLLTGNTYFAYNLNDQDQGIIKMDGELSSVLIENKSTHFEQTEQRVSGATSRLQYAFDSLTYRITKGTVYELGQTYPQEQEDYELESEEIMSIDVLKEYGVRLLQNPVHNTVRIQNTSYQDFHIQILTLDGKPIIGGILQKESINEYYIGDFPNVPYIIVVEDKLRARKYPINFIKSN